MKLISETQITSFKNFLDSHETFLIAGHKEPDGDCIASSIGISYILTHINKPFNMLNAGPFKRTEIKKYAQFFKQETGFMTVDDQKRCGLIIVDCSELSRLGEIDGDLKGFDTFIIDHHKTAVESENSIIDSTAPAAACIVQQLFEKLVGTPNKEEANILFFGTATDTGFFRFLNECDSEVFNSVSRLVQAGTSPREIYQEMTGGKGWNTRKLLGIMLNRAERYINGKLVITYETQEDTRKYGQEGRDSDALYTMMLSVEGVEVVVFVRQETEHSCTIGFRSKDRIDVSLVASKFGGGGHKNASGASTDGKIETLIPSIVKEFSRIM